MNYKTIVCVKFLMFSLIVSFLGSSLSMELNMLRVQGLREASILAQDLL